MGAMSWDAGIYEPAYIGVGTLIVGVLLYLIFRNERLTDRILLGCMWALIAAQFALPGLFIGYAFDLTTALLLGAITSVAGTTWYYRKKW